MEYLDLIFRKFIKYYFFSFINIKSCILYNISEHFIYYEIHNNDIEVDNMRTKSIIKTYKHLFPLLNIREKMVENKILTAKFLNT